MSSVQFLQPKLRLTSLLRKPGGPPAAEALAAAEANLAPLKGACAEEVRRQLEVAEAVFAGMSGASQPDALREIYAATVQVIGLGARSDLPCIDGAATSLCDLIDAMLTSGRCVPEAIGVHLRTWRLLLASDMPAEQAEALVEGLHQVSARFGAKEA